MFSRKAVVWLILLCGLIAAVSYPRFNRHDLDTAPDPLGTESLNNMSDARAYVAMVSYFRGELPLSSLEAPFCYRPVAPFLASWLPFPPQTSLNVLNEACLMAALILIYAFMARLGVGFAARIAACGLFAVSFPTFCYGAIGYVDPALILFIALALHLIVSDRWIAFGITTALASGVKESAGLVLFPAAAYLFARGELLRKKILVLPLGALIYLATYRLFQNWLLGSQDYGEWGVTLEDAQRNLGRTRSWAGMILVFGIPGILSLFAWKWAPESFRRQRPEMAALYGGVLAGLLLSFYALIGSAADGRTPWTIYPFAIPLSGIAIEGLLARRRAGASDYLCGESGG